MNNEFETKEKKDVGYLEVACTLHGGVERDNEKPQSEHLISTQDLNLESHKHLAIVFYPLSWSVCLEL
jgi:hypothetical protein